MHFQLQLWSTFFGGKVTRIRRPQPLAECAVRLGQFIARAHQAAGPVEELQEVGQTHKAEQVLAPDQWRSGRLGAAES